MSTRDLEGRRDGREALPDDRETVHAQRDNIPEDRRCFLSAPAPVQPAPAPKPLRERYSVVTDLDDALPEIPEIFDRRDVIRALGYEPPRTTLYHALAQLQREGAIAVETFSGGGARVRYRKLPSEDD